MKIRLRLKQSRPERFTEDGITFDVTHGSGPVLEIATSYTDKTPEIEVLRIFVDEHGRIK